MKTILSLIVFLVFSGNVLFAQTASLTVTNATCNGACNGAISSTTTGGTPPYTYIWDNAMTVPNPTGLCAGTYTVTVTDALGANGVFTATVTQPPILTVTISSQTNVTCFGMCDGSVFATAAGGTPPYSYNWSGGINTNICAGTYLVTITDANGCTTTSPSATITQPTALSAVITSQTNVSCNGLCDGTATVAVGGGISPYTYLWTNTQITPTATNLCAGVYTVTVVDVNNCTSVTNVTITEPAVLTATASNNGPVCEGQNIYFTASGGINYSWNGPIGYTSSLQNPTISVATLAMAGVFSVTVTNAVGCTAVATTTVVVNVTPNVNAGFDQTICSNNAQVNLSGIVSGGSSTGQWSGGSGTFAPNQFVLNATYVPSAGEIISGIVNLTLTSTNNGSCNAVTDQMVITIMHAPTPYITGTLSYCAGSSTMLDAGSGYISYVWSTGAVTQITNVTIANNPITVTVTDANGCTGTTSVTLTENALPNVTLTGTSPICAGQSSILTAGGAVSYVWDNSLPSGFSNTVSPLITTPYNITGTDANGCINTAQFTVTVNALAILSGLVSYSGGNLPSGDGTVNLFKQSTSGGGQFDSIASQIITATGYNFNNLMPGNYHIGVTLTNPSAYPNLVNTYYNNHFLWIDADTIVLVCNDNVTIPVLMYEFVSSPLGNCDLSGTILYGNYTGFKNTKAVGEPVPGAEILIEQEPNDVPIQSAITDGNGDYLLTNIAEGFIYKLLVDIPGYPLISTYSGITINSGDTAINNLNFLFDTSATGGIFIDTVLGFSNPFVNSGIISINVFPNPFAKYINVNFELSQNIDIVIDLISISGTESKELLNKPNCQKGNYNYKVSVPQNFAEGNYLIRIQAGNNVIVKKLILKN